MTFRKASTHYVNAVANRSKRYLSVVQMKGDRCWYCGTQLSNDWSLGSYGVLDHVEPKSKRGSDSLENIVPSCRYCNRLKADKSLEEFREYLKLKRCSAGRSLNFLLSALPELESDSSLQGELQLVRSAIDSLESRVSEVVFFGERGGVA